MTRIEIDPEAGFCSGVEKVIRTAEEILERGEELYGLGEMVHNSEEMERLRNKGLKTIGHQELSILKPCRVLFRAHGEPPETYRLAREQQIDVIDGTCPIVTRLQKKIGERYRHMDREKEQLVIFGKRDHPETIGLLGQVDGDAVVVSSTRDASKVDPSKRVHLFSQTTMDPEQFREMENVLKAQLEDSSPGSFRSDCTICGQMRRRKPNLAHFARRHEMVLFVSGKNSSNGKMLFEFCKSMNPRTYWISGSSELQDEWLKDTGSIGISGATSTSREQLESVASRVEKLTSS